MTSRLDRRARLALTRCRGFNLVELLVTIAVATILLTLGVPSLKATIDNSRAATQTNELLASIHLARSESIKTGRRVVLCKSDDATSCATDGGYDQGWVVFVDLDHDAALDSGESILRVHGPIGGSHGFSGDGDVASYIAFTSDGFARKTDGSMQSGQLTLDLCRPGSGKPKIVIKPTGRTGVETEACS
jgi:type IV fimbrial biogenesis protein FimT